MKLKKLFIFLAVPSLLLLSGCAHKVQSRKLMTISIGMTKSQIIALIGEPNLVRGSMTTKHDQVLDVWEYCVTRSRTAGDIAAITFTIGAAFLIGGMEETFWFYFCNDRLVQWC